MTLRGNGALLVPVLLLPIALAIGIVVLLKARVGGVRWFAVPLWPVALIVGIGVTGAGLPPLRASAEIGRVNHTATLLSDGRILVAGGGYDAATARASIYDPVADAWIPVAEMNRPRVLHAAVRLRDSRVLVIGGERFDSPQSAEIFDPGSGSWTLIEAPRSIKFSVAAVALPDGRIVAAGSAIGGGEVSAEIYDPRGGSWRTLAPLPSLRQVLALQTIDGRTILAVGYGEPQAVLINTSDGAVTPFGPSIGGVVAAVPLGQGRMLLITGPAHGEGSLAAIVIDAASGSKTEIASPEVRRYDISAVFIPEQFVLLAGGNQVGGSPPLGRPVSDAELLDLTTGRWSMVPPMQDARTGHTYTILADGRVIVIGGATRSGPLASAEIFDPRTRSWTVAAPMR
jgi:Galactose oxidase, central domain